MKLRTPGFDSKRAAAISRALVENSLRMRSMAFLSQIKMTVLLDTLYEHDEPIDYMRQMRDSVVAGQEDWLSLPVKISEEAKELQQMTLTMERRREELRHFLADQMQSLHRSEARFRQLFELIPDPVGLHRAGVWMFVNPAAVRAFGADSAEQLIGTPAIARVHPDDRATVLARIRGQVARGSKAPLLVERLLRLDGSTFWCEVQGIPLQDDAQELTVMVVMRDITEKLRSEAKMRQLATAVENTAEVVMISDAEACIEYVNPAFERMTGYTAAEVVGQFESVLRSGCHEAAFFRQICDTVKAGGIWTGEVIIKDKQGRLLTTERSVSPVIADDGSVSNHITVMRDVTREKEMQEKMEHTQRLESLGVLAGGIAHDFNNILTAIMGNAAMAERSLDSGSPVKEKLARIEQASQRASDLCRQMLAYSGKGQFVIKPVDLSEVVKDMTRLMEVSIHKHVEIQYHLAEQLPAVEADVAQLQQVILNLITNANEAIGDRSGVILFSSGVIDADAAYLAATIAPEDVKPGRYVFLEVSDSGCGMDAKTVQRMFDPFFTTKFTGRGLGMSAVLGIIRGHHGALRVASQPGRGTTFRILLPASDQQVVRAHARPAASGGDAQGMILVVDDEETIREVATMMLEDAGFAVLTAEDGLQAVELYREHQQEIIGVLLDMTMPKMDGTACFHALRSMDADVRIVLSSGYNEQDATAHLAGKGLAGFIQKPYSPEALKMLALKTWGSQSEAESS